MSEAIDERERFWERVHERLDSHGDPLDDADVQAWLVGHPGDIARVARLGDKLDVLARAAAPSPTAGPGRGWLIAAAALILGLITVARPPRRAAPAPSLSRPLPPSRVLAFDARVERTHGGVRELSVLDERGSSRTREARSITHHADGTIVVHVRSTLRRTAPTRLR